MGTNYIAPIWRQPRNANKDKLSNYSIDFGGNEYISANYNSIFNQSVYSFSFWVKNNANSGISNDGIITADSSNRGWSIFLQDNQTLKFNPNISGGSGQIDTSNFFNTTNNWIHCAITFDGSDLIIYKNGQSVNTSTSGTRNLNANNNNLLIGFNNFSTTRYFNGSISQVCLFDYALSTDQINYLYNLNNPMAITGGEPVAYWPLGDNSNPNAPGSFPNISVGADSVFDFNGTGGAVTKTGDEFDILNKVFIFTMV